MAAGGGWGALRLARGAGGSHSRSETGPVILGGDMGEDWLLYRRDTCRMSGLVSRGVLVARIAPRLLR